MADSAFEIRGLDGVLRALQALPKEVSQKRGGPVRASLRKGANIIRNEARKNVRRITTTPNIGGADRSTGKLEKSIAVVRGKTSLRRNEERMMVLIPKRARYPVDQRTPTGISVAAVGRMLEYGFDVNKKGRRYFRQPIPWMRPAFHAKKGEALDTIVRELRAGIDKAVRALGNGR